MLAISGTFEPVLPFGVSHQSFLRRHNHGCKAMTLPLQMLVVQARVGANKQKILMQMLNSETEEVQV